MNNDYFEVEPEESKFDVIFVDVTHKCNMECHNCYIPNRDAPDLSYDLIASVLRRVKKKTWIRLVGAEPTMRNDLPELIQLVYDKGHYPTIMTNGLKLASPKYVQMLKDTGLRGIYLSMNGAKNQKAYEDIDNHSHAHDLKFKALHNIMSHRRFFLHVGMIVAKGLNEHLIKDQAEILNDAYNQHNPRFKPLMKIRNIGKMGRYMEKYTMSFEELIDLTASQMDLSPNYIKAVPCATGQNAIVEGQGKGFLFEYKNILIKMTNWNFEDEDEGHGINKTLSRGRMTPEGKVAPWAEHLILNNYTY